MLDRRLNLIVKAALSDEYVTGYPKDFTKRLVTQKILYLMTHGNNNPKIKLIYDWSFYLRGPYSSEISSAIYHINNLYEEIDNKEVNLNKEEKIAIEKVKELRESLVELMEKHNVVSEEDALESIATMVYIIDQGGKRDNIIKGFKNLKENLYKNLKKSFLNELIELLEIYNYF
ncbi:MAG: hypothetical protein ACTSU9_17370 [Promethearchaeota archaeon]